MRPFSNQWESVGQFLEDLDNGLHYELTDEVTAEGTLKKLESRDNKDLFQKDKKYQDVLRITNTKEINIEYNSRQIQDLIDHNGHSQTEAIKFLEAQKRDYERLYVYFVRNLALPLKFDIETHSYTKYCKQLNEIQFGDYNATSVLVNNWYVCYIGLYYEFQREMHLFQRYQYFWNEYERYCLRIAYKQITDEYDRLTKRLVMPDANTVSLATNNTPPEPKKSHKEIVREYCEKNRLVKKATQTQSIRYEIHKELSSYSEKQSLSLKKFIKSTKGDFSIKYINKVLSELGYSRKPKTASEIY